MIRGVGSGVLGINQIPMAIQSSLRTIVVEFDIWGFTSLMEGSLEQG